MGPSPRSNSRLFRSLEYVKSIPRAGLDGSWVADVQIYALQGKRKKALAALREAIDDRWRTLWWYHLERDPNLESLHDDPEFQETLEELRADIAAQLGRVREMQRNGELESISVER
jgi:hypothetical protein